MGRKENMGSDAEFLAKDYALLSSENIGVET